MLSQDQIETLWESALDAYGYGWSRESVTLPNGDVVRLRVDGDDMNPFEEWDCYGTLHPIRRGESRAPRPTGVDGAARKVWDRHECYWWQPPADVKGTPAEGPLFARVRGLLQEEWSFLVVQIEVQGAACSHGNLPAPRRSAIGGIESDMDRAGVRELVADLFANVQ